MSDGRATSALLRCPDCGGILEPHRPGWAATIDVAAALDVSDAPSATWRCLLCGYQDGGESSELGGSAPSARSM